MESCSELQRPYEVQSRTSLHKRRVVINHEHEMPSDFGTTPGGTMFTHTPGGTRIVYERAFLLQMRQSPLARSPPANLPVIPGVTVPASTSPEKNCTSSSPTKAKMSEDCGKSAGGNRKSSMDVPTKLQTVNESATEEDDQFNLDM